MSKTSFSGPVRGSYICIPVLAGGVVLAGTHVYDAAIPTGMKVYLFGATYGCSVSTGGSFILGTTADDNGYLTTTTFVSLTSTYKAFDGALGNVEVDDADDLNAIITVGTTLTNAYISLWGYVTAHTSSLTAAGL